MIKLGDLKLGHSKLAQVSIFVAVAILILTVFMFYTQFSSRLESPISESEVVQIPPCLEAAMTKLAIQSALQGGFVYLSNETVMTPYGLSGVFADENGILAPTLDITSLEMARVAEFTFEQCVMKSHQNATFTTSPKIKVEFTDREIVASTVSSITIHEGNKNRIIPATKINIPIRYKTLYGYASEIGNKRAQSSGGLDLTYLDSLDVDTQATSLGQGVIAVYFKDPQSKTTSTYTFSAVYRYPPTLPDWKINDILNVPVSSEYISEAIGQGWEIWSDDSLVRTSGNKIIIESSESGIFNVTLTAINPSGEKYTKNLQVTLK